MTLDNEQIIQRRARPARLGRNRPGHGDPPVINTGTFGVAPQDVEVAAATVTVGQLLGSVGTSLLNTVFASAVASYIAAHLTSAPLIGRQALTGPVPTHGYDTGFWWIAGIFHRRPGRPAGRDLGTDIAAGR